MQDPFCAGIPSLHHLTFYSWAKSNRCYFCEYTAAAAKPLQSCPTLCDPVDGSPPGSTIPGILQARTLEWVAIAFSNAWKWKVKVKLLSHVRLFATPWTTAYQAPPSVGFSRPEYWSGVPMPSPCEYTSLSQFFLPDICCSYDKNNLSPAWLPKDCDFLWRQVILSKIPTFFRSCIRNSKYMLLLLSLTSDFYSSFNCMPHCSSPLESCCVVSSLLITTVLFTIWNI